MTEDNANDKTPVEHAVDLFVYAPLGFALEARELLPQLVERGRQQVTLAKMVGQFAFQQGQREATKVVGKAGEQAGAVLKDLGLAGGRPRTAPASSSAGSSGGPSAGTPAPVPTSAPVATTAGRSATNGTTSAAPATPAKPAPRSSTGAGTLAIADYDSLAASQVIPRLPGLSAAELEAVRVYESGHRGRKTILNRIAQLQSA